MSIAEKLAIVAQNEQKVYDAGIEQGNKDAFDAMWDAIQDNGARTAYNSAFNNAAWNDYTFRPKYSLVPTGSAGYMFSGSAISDLQKCLDYNGVVLDLKNSTNVYELFRNNKALTRVGNLDVSNATQCGGIFQACSALETVGLLTVSEKNTSYAGTFQNATGLTEIRVAGTIAINLSFQHSPLSVESMKSVISCLKNNSGTGEKKTITFSGDCWALLEASGPSPNGGTWEEYIVSLGWEK